MFGSSPTLTLTLTPMVRHAGVYQFVIAEVAEEVRAGIPTAEERWRDWMRRIRRKHMRERFQVSVIS